jgi:hypothetical protein
MSSNMSNKTLGIIFAFLAIIVFFMFVWDGDKNERTFREQLVTIDTANVDEILIYPKTKTHGEIKLFKDDAGWNVRVNESLTAQVAKSKIDGIFGQLLSIKPKRLAARGEDKWSSFQVDSVGTRVKVYEDGDETLDIILGRFNFQQVPQQQQRFGRQQPNMSTFVRLGNDTDVYEVDGFLETFFNQGANSFRDGSVISGDYNKWNKLTYSYPADSSFTMIKLNDKWFANDEVTDSAKTATFLRQISNIRNSSFIDDVDHSSLGNPTYSLSIEGENGNTISVKGYLTGEKYLIHTSKNPNTLFDGNSAKLGEKIFVGMGKVMPDK